MIKLHFPIPRISTKTELWPSNKTNQGKNIASSEINPRIKFSIDKKYISLKIKNGNCFAHVLSSSISWAGFVPIFSFKSFVPMKNVCYFEIFIRETSCFDIKKSWQLSRARVWCALVCVGFCAFIVCVCVSIVISIIRLREAVIRFFFGFHFVEGEKCRFVFNVDQFDSQQKKI